jgi:plastocyanin
MTRPWHATAVLVLLEASIAAGAGAIKGTVRTDGAGGTPLADAVVMVEGPSVASPAGAPHVVIDQRNLTFVPRVIAVAVGTTVDFPNHDSVLHNVFSASPAKKFDLGMYAGGASRSVTFENPGVVRIGCNVHPKMEAFVVVHPNPYVAVTDARGVYTIRDVPAGSYQIRFWQPERTEKQVPITVRDGAVQPLDAELGAR